MKGGARGLEDILMEGNIYGASAVAKILEGKSYNRGTLAHKVTYKALWPLKLEEFGEWAIAQNDIGEEEQNRIINASQECVRQFGLSIKTGRDLLSSVENFILELNLLLPYLQIFEDLAMAASQTAAFWNLYLKLVQLLLDYVAAERDSKILLHLETFAEILPFDFICDHQNYAKLQTDRMDVFQNFFNWPTYHS